MLHLFPGRKLREAQVRGVRNLVAAAIPNLDPQKISLVDSDGTPLDADADTGKAMSDFKAETERELRERVLTVLLPAVGADSVVAQVTADVDMTRVETTEKVFDADNPALRSEHVRNREKASAESPRGVVGAAGNAPGTQTARGANPPKNETDADETRNYELSTTVTRRVVAMPRVSRVSVAVLIEAKKDNPRSPEEIAQLTALAKRAVGFDASRGDQIEITASAFARGEEPAVVAAAPIWQSPAALGGGAVVLLVLGALALLLLRKRKASDSEAEAAALLTAGGRVDDLESAMARELVKAEVNDIANDDEEMPQEAGQRSANDVLLDRARDLAETDPARAAHLLHAWLESDRKNLLEENAHVG